MEAVIKVLWKDIEDAENSSSVILYSKDEILKRYNGNTEFKFGYYSIPLYLANINDEYNRLPEYFKDDQVMDTYCGLLPLENAVRDILGEHCMHSYEYNHLEVNVNIFHKFLDETYESAEISKDYSDEDHDGITLYIDKDNLSILTKIDKLIMNKFLKYSLESEYDITFSNETSWNTENKLKSHYLNGCVLESIFMQHERNCTLEMLNKYRDTFDYQESKVPNSDNTDYYKFLNACLYIIRCWTYSNYEGTRPSDQNITQLGNLFIFYSDLVSQLEYMNDQDKEVTKYFLDCMRNQYADLRGIPEDMRDCCTYDGIDLLCIEYSGKCTESALCVVLSLIKTKEKYPKFLSSISSLNLDEFIEPDHMYVRILGE